MRTSRGLQIVGVLLAATVGVVSSSTPPAGAWPGSVTVNGPTGSDEFGKVWVLPNGNVVVTDSSFDSGATLDVGAVHVYDGVTHALISTLTGTVASSFVGSGGIAVLSNGNFVVKSPFWRTAGDVSVGAATWGSATTGISGTVSSSNSLIGSTANDTVGSFVIPLTNGNYVLATPNWNGVAIDTGAIAWGNGSTGTAGTVSSSNSLVGTATGDGLGSQGVVALTNGNYVVGNPQWNNGVVADAGAVVWGNGATGLTVGSLSAANALVGTTAGDNVGETVTALANGKYVVTSSQWNGPGVADAGAVTVGNGATGTVGSVSSANSLVGSTAGDQVGQGGLTANSSSRFIVDSPFWDNPAGPAADAGAATFVTSTSPPTGAVSASNSLVGDSANDLAGISGVVVLTNGNFVVKSSAWDGPSVADIGAATWVSGTTGLTGAISGSNSLVGSSTLDQVSNGGVRALANGNYVVATPGWDGPSAADAGAVTWGNGATGTAGAVSAANSLVGSTAGDQFPNDVVVLTNGNYVAFSATWDGPSAADAGAATWGNGATGTSGAVSAANSLVGTAAGDSVAGAGVTALANGNYVVASPNWDAAGPTSSIGAATWAKGDGSTVGAVSAANSLVGSSTSDGIGYNGVVALTNGNYVVRSAGWDGPGPVQDVGAVTWGNGALGTTGIVGDGNSLVGSSAFDAIGTADVTALPSGDYVVALNSWDGPGPVANAGGVAWGNGTAPTTSGTISAFDAVVGLTALGGGSISWAFDAAHGTVVVGRPKDNALTWFDPPAFLDVPAPGSTTAGSMKVLPNGNVVVADPGFDTLTTVNAGIVRVFNGATHAVVSTLVGSTNGDAIGSAGITVLTNGNFVIDSPAWDSPSAVVDVGAVTWGSATTGVSGTVSSSNSLVGATASDAVGSGGVVALSNGNYVVSSAAWNGLGNTTDVGAVTWANGTTGRIGVVSSSNSLVGTDFHDEVGIVTPLTNGNYVVASPVWDGGANNKGAVTWADGTTGITGTISSANSLVGTTGEDRVGEDGITALTNGNYVVRSPGWDGAFLNVGAATWANGTTGITGTISSSNSLVGTTQNDNVSDDGVVALTNGNYVVVSATWNSAQTDVGAVTWGDGATGRTGTVSTGNSLFGSLASDNVGSGGVVALDDGNYVVVSPNWDLPTGPVSDVGAVTLGNGASGSTGTVSSTNSLVGSTIGDSVASGGVTPLVGGAYVISSPLHGVTDTGAATFGGDGIAGTISSANSLVGVSSGDQVSSGGITALTNGNFVISSPLHGPNDTGAVTFSNGANFGAVNSGNSLVGGVSNDQVGSGGVTALTNGNFVVASPLVGATDTGAVTWGDGTLGHAGNGVGSQFSLIGGSPGDQVGSGGVTALANGNYVVASPSWDDSVVNTGAVTWGNGTSGTTGVADGTNSRTGTNGGISVLALPDGNYGVLLASWSAPVGSPGAGAAFLGDGATGTTVGALSIFNTVVGTTAGGGVTWAIGFDTVHLDLVVAHPADGVMTWLPLKPGAPTSVSAAAGVGSADVSWSASPAGATPTTSYTVTASPGGATCNTGALACTVTGLSANLSYTFTVRGENTFGVSAPSAPSAPVTPTGAPLAPGKPTATAGNGSVTLVWTAASATGSPVTSYTVTSSPEGLTCTTGALSCAVPDLLNGTSYTFTVRASSAAGVGPASAPSDAVVPHATIPATFAGKDTLASGKFLTAGQYLLSKDARTLFGLLGDGNLVLVVNDQWKFQSNTAGQGVVKALMNKNGALELLNAGGTVIWSSNTTKKGSTIAVLDGKVVIKSGSKIQWTQGTAIASLKAKGGNSLSSGATLAAGRYLLSTNKQCAAAVIGGKLVSWGPGGIVHYRSPSVGAVTAKLQTTGNLQLLNLAKVAVFSTGTTGKSAKLTLSNACALVLATKTATLWQQV